MCKPAAEVANANLIESYTTRARALMLWRIAKGFATFTKRDVEILYQSTLDSVSKAWCVNHYPVNDYMVSGRSIAFKTEYTPPSVKSAVEREPTETESPSGTNKSHVLLLAGEAAECDNNEFIAKALKVLGKCGIEAEPAVVMSGALAYSLGAIEKAREQAKRVIDLMMKSQTHKVIVDGPQTQWALLKIYPNLNVSLPETVSVTNITEEIFKASSNNKIKPVAGDGEKVIIHDSRSACLVADTIAKDKAILPDFNGPEELLGTGRIYETSRELIDIIGMKRVFNVWSRSLSKSCGADDGLWLTYPEIAKSLARQRLDDFKNMGAEMVITDSPLCKMHLSNERADNDVQVKWVPELFI